MGKGSAHSSEKLKWCQSDLGVDLRRFEPHPNRFGSFEAKFQISIFSLYFTFKIYIENIKRKLKSEILLQNFQIGSDAVQTASDPLQGHSSTI